ncbi:MAG TPA: RNA-binding S4 domain-containing protein [Saprospiraceae bacterium]|nr:RNA-binding S4 domain-containing protein [Saprospiraceae bacterium]
MADKVRIDKYLWSIRIFKSRTLATDACKEGKVKLHEENAKPSAMVTVGDIIDVVKDGFKLKYKVIQLIEKRVSPILAKPCYEDLTPEEEINKYKSWFIGKGGPERRERGAGRPTKRDRREIDEFKDYYEGED